MPVAVAVAVGGRAFAVGVLVAVGGRAVAVNVGGRPVAVAVGGIVATIIEGAVGLFIAPLALWLLSLLGIRIGNLAVSGRRLFAAFVGFLPPELLIAAFVYLLAGRLGAGATLGLGGGLLVVAFLLELVGPLLKWPAPILGLSIFHRYGAPIIEGPR